MKMPSTVSSDRIGCNSRLFTPSWKVRSKNIIDYLQVNSSLTARTADLGRLPRHFGIACSFDVVRSRAGACTRCGAR